MNDVKKWRCFNNDEVINALAEVLRGKIRIREGSNLEKDLSGDYPRRAGNDEKKNASARRAVAAYAGRLLKRNGKAREGSYLAEDVRRIIDAGRGREVFCDRVNDEGGC